MACRTGTGSGLPDDGGNPPPDYPGKTLGLRFQAGFACQAPMGRRLAALLIDWLIAYGHRRCWAWGGVWSTPMLSTVVLVIWLLLGWRRSAHSGSTPGRWSGSGREQWVAGGRWGSARLVIRLLIRLVVPPLFTGGRAWAARSAPLLAVVRR